MPKKEYRRYDLEFKEKILNYYYEHSNRNFSECERVFGIDRRIIANWLKLEDRIRNSAQKKSIFRIKNNMNRAYFPEMESRLIQWILEKRVTSCISGVSIRKKALDLFAEFYSDKPAVEFKASNGWLFNFLTRNNLILRRISPTGRDLQGNTINLAEEFINKNKEFIQSDRYKRCQIFNMDETSVSINFSDAMMNNLPKCSKNLKIGEQQRRKISVLFCANANGSKLPIFIVVPKELEISEYLPPDNVILVYKESSIIDEDVLIAFYKRCLKPFCLQHDLDKSILYLDNAKLHTANRVNLTAVSNDVNNLILPSKMENLLQPANVCWFPVLKKNYHMKWQNWCADEAALNSSPTYCKVVEWLSEIWYDLDRTVIWSSFDNCGITSNDALHGVLKQMIENKIIFNEYLDTFHSSDEIDAFNEDPSIFENAAIATNTSLSTTTTTTTTSYYDASNLTRMSRDLEDDEYEESLVKHENDILIDDEHELMSYLFDDNDEGEDEEEQMDNNFFNKS